MHYWSEGFARAAYFVPGCDGIGVWPNSEIVPAASASASSVTMWSQACGHRRVVTGVWSQACGHRRVVKGMWSKACGQRHYYFVLSKFY